LPFMSLMIRRISESAASSRRTLGRCGSLKGMQREGALEDVTNPAFMSTRDSAAVSGASCGREGESGRSILAEHVEGATAPMHACDR
jgi:hypothetical protein